MTIDDIKIGEHFLTKRWFHLAIATKGYTYGDYVTISYQYKNSLVVKIMKKSSIKVIDKMGIDTEQNGTIEEPVDLISLIKEHIGDDGKHDPNTILEYLSGQLETDIRVFIPDAKVSEMTYADFGKYYLKSFISNNLFDYKALYESSDILSKVVNQRGKWSDRDIELYNRRNSIHPHGDMDIKKGVPMDEGTAKVMSPQLSKILSPDTEKIVPESEGEELAPTTMTDGIQGK
jgi:hypothetical protein